MIDTNELRQSLGAVQPEEVAELLDRLEAAEKERDALRAKVEAMEKQEPIGVLHVGSCYGEELEDWEFEADCVEAAKAEIKALRSELVDLRSSMAFRTSLVGRIEAERDALRAKIAAMERQKPVAWTPRRALELVGRGTLGFHACGGNQWGEQGAALYALPGAKGE